MAKAGLSKPTRYVGSSVYELIISSKAPRAVNGCPPKSTHRGPKETTILMLRELRTLLRPEPRLVANLVSAILTTIYYAAVDNQGST
ncbi:hypothetical protein BDN67DRAFT_391067 [Paxillus ammoniavirescens]|nr:hypothetical protein BDN67DRAFT_391067 [Paxillus ammoniavirescens]